MHGRDGAETALAACLTSEGARCWARSTDAELMARLMAEECVGLAADLDPDGTLHI
jgi:hypothetical protein